MKLSVIIPVYNEKDTIKELISLVEAVDIKGVEKELIIVDDFSTDGTRDILRSLNKHRVFYHKKNYGKGSSTRTGLKQATGDIIIIQDADLEYNPQDYKKLIVPLIKGQTNVVYGSRFLGGKMKIMGKGRVIIPLHFIGNSFLSFMTRILFFRKITDMETCYKMFNKSALKGIKLRARRFEFEPEITAKFIRKGEKIIEIPISYNSRDFSEGKKIDWKDGIKALFWLVRFRFFD